MNHPLYQQLGFLSHYRPLTEHELLGLRAEEQDPQVIEEAALRQMERVRVYQLTYPRECFHLLNAIAQAFNHLCKKGHGAGESSRSTSFRRNTIALGKPVPVPRKKNKKRLTALIFDPRKGPVLWKVTLQPVSLPVEEHRRLAGKWRQRRRANKDPLIRLQAGAGQKSVKLTLSCRAYGRLCKLLRAAKNAPSAV